MRAVQSHWFATFVLASAAAQSCQAAHVSSYLEQLECGMTLQEVRGKSDAQIKPVGQHRLGNYRANFGRNAVWLEFAEDHLRSATSQTLTGLTSARLSPKKDLCTGGLTYFVSLAWVTELEKFQKPDVYLDGELVAKRAAAGVVLEMSDGQHVIRLESPGFVPVERKIVLDEESYGDQWIDFLEVDPLAG